MKNCHIKNPRYDVGTIAREWPLDSGSPGSRGENFHSANSWKRQVPYVPYPLILPAMITRTVARCTRSIISVPTRLSISPVHFHHQPQALPSIIQPHSRRTFAAKTSADEQVEELQELSVSVQRQSLLFRLLTMITGTQQQRTSSK